MLDILPHAANENWTQIAQYCFYVISQTIYLKTSISFWAENKERTMLNMKKIPSLEAHCSKQWLSVYHLKTNKSSFLIS